MKKRVTHLMTIAAVLLTVVCSAVNSAAENNKAKLDTWRTINFDTVTLEPSILYMPLMFESYDSGFPVEEIEGGVNNWLSEALARRASHRSTLNAAMMSHPELVGYNVADMPEVPKEHVVTADPSRNKLVITETPPEVPAVVPVVEAREVKKRNWLHTFKGSLHFTQAYISDNWYQGGENNMNVLGDIQWDFNLNQVLHPNLLFNNTLHYKVGVMTAHNDSLRHYALNEDNFQFTSQFGYKAVKNWYYSASLLFKTQMFKNYKSNTRTMTAAFLSPAELNVGLGMTYSYKDKTEDHVFTLSLAPLSYNLKICRDIHNLDPVSFGIDAGHHTKHNIGSNLEAKYICKFNPNIVWTSRLYAFTNYDYTQGDWENTFDFSVTRHLNTQLYVHLRYDKSRPWNEDWRYWQLKEILSFGLTYRFATN